MRPFKIPKTHIWVDLDTIQWIAEPRFRDLMGHGGYFIELNWQHTFRSEADSSMFEQPAKWKGKIGGGLEPEGGEDCPSRLSEIKNEVFIPFWQAWAERDYEG